MFDKGFQVRDKFRRTGLQGCLQSGVLRLVDAFQHLAHITPSGIGQLDMQFPFLARNGAQGDVSFGLALFD